MRKGHHKKIVQRRKAVANQSVLPKREIEACPAYPDYRCVEDFGDVCNGFLCVFFLPDMIGTERPTWFSRKWGFVWPERFKRRSWPNWTKVFLIDDFPFEWKEINKCEFFKKGTKRRSRPRWIARFSWNSWPTWNPRPTRFARYVELMRLKSIRENTSISINSRIKDV